MIDALLQWIGYAGIVLGYILFQRSKRAGSAVSLVGSVALGFWAAMQAPLPWGVLALQITCTAINLFTLRKEVSHENLLRRASVYDGRARFQRRRSSTPPRERT